MDRGGILADRRPQRAVTQLALGSLLAIAIVSFAVLAVHLIAWLNAEAVASDSGSYAPFVLAPVVIASAIRFGVAASCTVLLAVLPRGLLVATTLVGAAALVVAVTLDVGFDVSSARRNPFGDLTTTVDRVVLPASLRATLVTRTVANNDTPAVDKSWRGTATSLSCGALQRAVERAFPGASVDPGVGLRCALTAFWNRTTIPVLPEGIGTTSPINVELLAYLIS